MESDQLMDPYESPFTWDMDEQYTEEYDVTELKDDEEIHLLNIINSIMISFIHSSRSEHVEAEQNLENTLDVWKKLDRK